MIRKSDQNQSEIVEGLRACGYSVQVLSHVGHGCPDLLVGTRRRNYLFEIKNPEQSWTLTEDEARWHSEWRGRVDCVTTLEEALRILNGGQE